jgi:hypothetical protein
LYPICHKGSGSPENLSLRLDLHDLPMHFWDPMLKQSFRTGTFAPRGATMSLAGSMMFTTIIMTTTRTRGASG